MQRSRSLRHRLMTAGWDFEMEILFRFLLLLGLLPLGILFLGAAFILLAWVFSRGQNGW